MTHPIPLSAIDAHTAVLGKTGTGKSYTARGLAEQLLAAGRQVVILDPTGAWWGLRSEFEIPIFGGDHGDVAINDASGAAVAAAIVEQQTSAIVDLKLLAKESGAAMRRFVSAFAKRLKAKPVGAFYLIIDEADEFLPQNIGGGDTQLFGHLKWMVRRGRIDGFRVMMVTQRPAEIAKAVLTQIETLICHRVTAPQDRKAIEEWVKGHSDSDQAKEVLNSLAALEKGEAWVWAPEHDILTRTAIPANRSHDSSATPDADTGVIEQPELAEIDLSGIRDALAPPEDNHVPDAGKKVDSGEADKLRMDLIQAQREAEHYRELADRRGNALIEQHTLIRQAWGKAEVLAKMLNLPPDAEMPLAFRETKESPVIPEPTLQANNDAVVTANHGNLDLTNGAWKMVQAVAKHHPRPLPLAHVAALSAVSMKSSQWTKNKASFEGCPLIEKAGGFFALTRAGIEEFQVQHQPDDPQAIVAFWSQTFPPSTAKMLNALFEHKGVGPLNRNEIADAAGVSRTSSGLGSGLAELVRCGLVVQKDKGYYEVSEVLR